MAGLLGNFRNTIALSLVLSLIMIGGYAAHGGGFENPAVWQAATRWAHIVAGILWIGLLYYFNFVQIRVMPNVPAELKPGVTKYIAPEALFWFRWAAVATLVFGLLLALERQYIVEALTLGFAGVSEDRSNFRLIGVGMWLAIIMAANVWMFIWPNQRIALGIGVEADAEAKAKAAKTAMLFSRTNLLLSFPMLVTMGMHQTVFG